jgi:hypothetical protein
MTKTDLALKRGSLFGLLIILALTTLLSCTGGGGGSGGRATEIATTAYDAFRDADWATYASWMHPDALGRYESILRPLFDGVIQVDSAGNMPTEFQWFDSTVNTEEFLNMTPREFVHVVVRTSAEAMGVGMTEVSVLTTAMSEGEYRLMLSGQIESLATAIARGMGGR